MRGMLLASLFCRLSGQRAAVRGCCARLCEAYEFFMRSCAIDRYARGAKAACPALQMEALKYFFVSKTRRFQGFWHSPQSYFIFGHCMYSRGRIGSQALHETSLAARYGSHSLCWGRWTRSEDWRTHRVPTRIRRAACSVQSVAVPRMNG